MTAITGVPKGERAPERRLTNRNGYRERRWDTRVGTIASGRRGCDPGLLQLIHPSSCGGLTLVLCSTLLPPTPLGLARDRQAVMSGTEDCDDTSQDQTCEQPEPAKPRGIARDLGRLEGATRRGSVR